MSYKLVLKPRKWRIFRDDFVQVIRGSEKGKQGKILKINRKLEKIIVEGVNIKKKKESNDQ